MSCRKRNGYFTFILIAINEPTIKPIDSAVITNDQDLAPLKCSSAINGPNIFSAAAQHITIKDQAKTKLTIHLNDKNTPQPYRKSVSIEFSVPVTLGVR